MGLLMDRGRKRPQFKWRAQAFEVGDSVTLPSPFGGLNLRDDITALKKNEARVLVNFFPSSGLVEIRPGKARFAAGMGATSDVKTLAGFTGHTVNALLACAFGKIWDVTAETYYPGNDANTKVLLPFTGADATTTLTDINAGGSAHVWTPAGNAQIDTAEFKFQGSSGLFDGTGDWWTTPAHADYNLGANPFTIEGWFKCNAAGGTFKELCGQAVDTVTAATLSFTVLRTNGNVMAAGVSNGSTVTVVTGTTQFTNAVNPGWHRLVFTRDGNILRLFIDGVQEGGDVAFTGSVPSLSSALRIGTASDAVANPWLGWIDEFRLSNTARWTANHTSPTAPYAPKLLAAGFAQDAWQWALYNNTLHFVNGADAPQVYNGTTAASIGWTGAGLTNTNLVNVALVRNRLWFAENNSADVWYGAIGQITAASPLTKFQLSQIASGGFCMAIGAWSREDAGAGADDFTVFMMSTGEVIVYQGDPGTTFALIGKYDTAPPVGRHCLTKVGGELVITTRLGFLPISAAVAMAPGKALDFSSIDPWGKIAVGVVEDAAAAGNILGWDALAHLGVFYANVPLSTIISKQWVLNTRTAAWANYHDFNAAIIGSFDSQLYFGGRGDGSVWKITGTNDDGKSITAQASGAFIFPSKAQKTNLFTAARVRLQAQGRVTGIVGVNTDFWVGANVGVSIDFSSVSTGSGWDTSPWDTTEWGNREETNSGTWTSVYGEGRAVGVRLQLNSGDASVKWFATDLLFKPGGIK